MASVCLTEANPQNYKVECKESREMHGESVAREGGVLLKTVHLGRRLSLSSILNAHSFKARSEFVTIDGQRTCLVHTPASAETQEGSKTRSNGAGCQL
jgi:hypothetical protein